MRFGTRLRPEAKTLASLDDAGDATWCWSAGGLVRELPTPPISSSSSSSNLLRLTSDLRVLSGMACTGEK